MHQLERNKNNINAEEKKGLESFQQLINNQILQLQKQLQPIQAAINESIRIFNEGHQIQRKEYKQRFKSLKHYLAKEGDILPLNADDFFMWYMEKHGDTTIPEFLKLKPQDIDFKEYSEWRKQNFKKEQTNNPKKKPSRREILIQLYKEKGELSRLQCMAAAEKWDYDEDSMADFYTRKYDEIKKAATRLK